MAKKPLRPGYVAPEPEGEFWKQYAEKMPNPEANPGPDPQAVVEAAQESQE